MKKSVILVLENAEENHNSEIEMLKESYEMKRKIINHQK